MVTPGMVQGEIRTIHAKMQQMGKIIMRSPKVSEQMRAEWQAYASEWSAWRKAHITWLDRLGTWGGTWDKVLKYKKRTNRWVVRLVKLGLMNRGEILPKDPPSPWGNVLLGVGLLIGLVIWQKTKG